MRETQFIEQNQEKWRQFEQTLREDANTDPDELHDIFIQVTDDLSHARTFYPTRSVRAYLNGVAQVVYTHIFKQKKSPLSKLRYFFTDELPQVVYESRWSFFWALVFFAISFGIGYFSSIKDPEFLRVILGDGYVDMTVENIKKGDPMAVYKNSGRFDMTMSIMVNNMWVCLFYFILGIFAGIGSVAMMMYNGVMLGAFLQFFAQQGLAREANLTVWMHGALEISAIVIGTAAGITMGRGLLFPGTYSRFQSFQMSARRGIKIMVGVMVMLFFAAIIEGNLTRHTGAGDWVRGLFIALCFGSVIFYYGWLPFYKAKKGFAKPFREAELPPNDDYEIDYFKIKNGGEVFGDTFTFFQRNISFFTRLSAIAAGVFCLAIFAIKWQEPDEVFKINASFFDQADVIGQFFINDKISFLPLLNGAIYTALFAFIFSKILRGEKNESLSRAQLMPVIGQMFIVITANMFLMSSAPIFTFLFFVVVMPFMGLWLYLIFRDNFNFIQAVRHAWWLMGSGRMQFFGTHLTMLPLCYLLFSGVNSIILNIYLQFIGWNMSFLTEAQFDQTTVLMMTFAAAFILFISLMLMFTAYGFLYYSLLEINEANSLFKKIDTIGSGKKIRGMARE